jgi:hypothetical protein
MDGGTSSWRVLPVETLCRSERERRSSVTRRPSPNIEWQRAPIPRRVGPFLCARNVPIGTVSRPPELDAFQGRACPRYGNVARSVRRTSPDASSHSQAGLPNDRLCDGIHAHLTVSGGVIWQVAMPPGGQIWPWGGRGRGVWGDARS